MATSNMWGAVGGLLGGAPMPTAPAAPAPIDNGFYNSQFYKDYQNNSMNSIGTADMYNSPYFGQMGSGSVGQAQDKAYEQYLASIGKPVSNPNPIDFNLFNSLTGGTPASNFIGGKILTDMPQQEPQSYQEFLKGYISHVLPPSEEEWNMRNLAKQLSPPPTPNNFNFTPTPIGASGSYNTSDWMSVLGGLATGGLTGAASGAGINDAVARLQALGGAGLTDYTNLAKASTEGISFTPYTLTSALGTTKQTAPGVISQELTPQQQANVEAAQRMQGSLYGAAVPDTSGIAQGAFTGAQAGLAGVGTGQEDLAALRAGYGTAAQGMTGMLGGSTTDMANQLFQQQQAMRTPEQQRQQLELENRLRAQGRLGTTTAAYGGTPEQLAMAKAVQEQQASDAFNSMTQAEQMATSQQARALGLGSATSTLAQAQQALRAGDIQNAAGLFNIGSSAAQLPQQMQGQQIAQAGQLQSQALAPAAAQLQQAQQAGTMGQQQGELAAKAGGLFGQVAGAGLQERLTAESAAAALRGKQYTSALSALANQGGASGTAANTIQGLINKGIKNIDGKLYDASNKLLGSASDLIGEAATSLWSGIGNLFDTDAQFEADWQDALAGQLTSDDPGGASGIIADAWDTVTNWFDF